MIISQLTKKILIYSRYTEIHQHMITYKIEFSKWFTN